MKPINFHTHHPILDDNSIEIYVEDIRKKAPLNSKIDYFCTGLHPWYLNESSFSDISSRLIDVIDDRKFFGLGEIGLDKCCKMNFEFQQKIFQKQVELANKLSIKTIILHSVKSNNECFKTLRDSKYKGNILFHDFSGNKQELVQFQREFNCIISLGKRFLESKNSKELLSNIDLKKVVLETDDQTNFSIFSIQDMFSKITGLSHLDINKNSHASLQDLKQN
jgi:TatD DNase family protein